MHIASAGKLSVDPLREQLFADQSLEEHIGKRAELAEVDPASPARAETDWLRLFLLALVRQRRGDFPEAREALLRAVTLPGLDTRTHLLAWEGLRYLCERPAPAQADEVLGVVVETAPDLGGETLAIYADGSVRLVGPPGSGVERDAQAAPQVQAILAAGQALVTRAPLRRRQRGPLPVDLKYRISLLTRGGLHPITLPPPEPPPPADPQGWVGQTLFQRLGLTRTEERAVPQPLTEADLQPLLAAVTALVRFLRHEDNEPSVPSPAVEQPVAVPVTPPAPPPPPPATTAPPPPPPPPVVTAPPPPPVLQGPAAATAYQQLGAAHLSRQELGAALAAFDRALELDPQCLPAHINRGNVLLAQGKVELALAAYTEGLRRAPESAQVHFYCCRAEAYERQGDAGRAAADYGAVLRLAPHHLQALINRSRVHLQLRRYEEARADADQALKLNPQEIAALVNRGIALRKSGRHAEATADFTQALNLEPGNLPALLNRALTALEQDQPQAAIDDFTRVLERDPENAAVRSQLGMTYWRRGLVSARAGNLTPALADFEQAVRIAPDFAPAHRDHGLALLQQGAFQKAIDALTDAIRLDPQSAVAHGNRGQAHFSIGNFSQALADFSEALRCDPDLVPAYHLRGRTHAQVGAFDRAVADFSEGLRRDPNHLGRNFMRNSFRGAAADLGGG